MNHDPAIRAAAFQRLFQLVSHHGPELRWSLIEEGFTYQGQRIRFANRARGIFRPKEMSGSVLSLKTVVPRSGREAIYDDQGNPDPRFLYGEHLAYAMMGTNPDAHANQLMYKAYQETDPLIYFLGIAPGIYTPLWPVFITKWDRAGLRVGISTKPAVTKMGQAPIPTLNDGIPLQEIQRRYEARTIKQRVHQSEFRRRVLQAYDTRCTICTLPLPPLLEAAHIIPDSSTRGHARVDNGLSLCRLHHGAYDRHLIGIRGDRTVEVARQVRERREDIVFKSLGAYHGQRLHLPKAEIHRPRSEALEERFEIFRSVGG